MQIENDTLYEERCNKCLYCEEHKCVKSGWRVPSHDFCLSFVYKSTLTKNSSSKDFSKKISLFSTWGDILLCADESSYIPGSHSNILDIAVEKKSGFFYNLIPRYLNYCDLCDLYFENKEVCVDCGGELNNVDFDLQDVEDLIFDFLLDEGYLVLSNLPEVVRVVQYLTLSDIRIMED